MSVPVDRLKALGSRRMQFSRALRARAPSPPNAVPMQNVNCLTITFNVRIGKHLTSACDCVRGSLPEHARVSVGGGSVCSVSMHIISRRRLFGEH